MKILMTTDTVGGVWTYALDLAKSLAAHGVEVALATMGPAASEDQRRAARGLGNVTLHESTFKLEWMEEPWRDVDRAGRWLLELEHELRPDLIHLNGYVHGALPFVAPIVVAAHSCVLSWWRAVKREAAPARWRRYELAVARGLHDADVVVAPSAAMLAAIQENYGALSRTRVIHNGRDSLLFKPARKEELILAAGRLWDEAKNIAALERVVDRIAWPIYVAGEGREASDGVRALGRLSAEELAGWLGRAGIYALPARYEPFGLSALEAAMSGCALVLGDIASLREVWGEAAVFVSPDDPRQLREALRRLINAKRLRAQFAQAAMERAQRYTLGRMGQLYAALYQTTVARQQALVRPQIAPAWPVQQQAEA